MGAYTSQEAMKTVYSSGKVTIPDNCECTIKSRLVQVKGPRGTLTKSFKHMSVDLCKLDDKSIQVEKWFGASKELAIIKTVCSHIQNLFIGVNFIGQKVKFHVKALDGVTMERNPGNNAEIIFQGNDIENVSGTCALINQSCAVKNKDIRKF